MTELEANEEALRIATEVFCEERRRTRRKTPIILFLIILNLLSWLLLFECKSAERKGLNDGPGDRDACAADTVSQTT